MYTFRKKLLIGCLCIAWSLLPTVSAQASDYVSVAHDKVNVRSGPGTENPINFQLFEGYPLKVVEHRGSWLKIVDFENDSGWIEGTMTRPGDTVIVNTKSFVNLRSEPNTSSSIVATLDRGVVLKKIGIKDQWIQVRHSSGVSGWISQSLVWP